MHDDLPELPDTPTGRYRHLKGGVYEVLGAVRHSETLAPMVLYRALSSGTGLWVRPHAMFFETVMVAGQPRRRFEPLPVGDGGSGDDDDDVGDDGGAG